MMYTLQADVKQVGIVKFKLEMLGFIGWVRRTRGTRPPAPFRKFKHTYIKFKVKLPILASDPPKQVFLNPPPPNKKITLTKIYRRFHTHYTDLLLR